MFAALYSEGITEIAVDSIFMMPQLGVLSEVHESAALEVFHKDCLIRLGTCISPIGNNIKPNQTLFSYKIDHKDKGCSGEINYGDLKLIELPKGEYLMTIEPAKNIDIGKGIGEIFQGTIKGGEVGLLLDGRGRPLDFSLFKDRVASILEWSKITKEYSI